MSEVLDLNDLVQSVKFTVLEKNYEIPPMNDVKMKKVMKLSKKISELSGSDKDDKKISDKDDKKISEDDDRMTDKQEEELLDTQNTILHECVSLNVNDKLTQIDKEDFSLWPMRLKNKVLELVFNQIGSGDVEGEAEKN